MRHIIHAYAQGIDIAHNNLKQKKHLYFKQNQNL